MKHQLLPTLEAARDLGEIDLFHATTADTFVSAENLALYQASLFPDLPEDLLKSFAKCDRSRLMKLTQSSNKQESEAAWEVLSWITARLEQVFPTAPLTVPVQFSYWEV